MCSENTKFIVVLYSDTVKLIVVFCTNIAVLVISTFKLNDFT
jgi:hypothetical protein